MKGKILTDFQICISVPLIKLELFYNSSVQLLTIFWRTLSQIQANQSNLLTLKISQSITLSGAHVIEITKACTVTFMKARNYLALRCRKKRVR